MDSQTTQLFLLVASLSLSLGAIILTVINVRYSDLAKHRREVARYAREIQKEFDALEEKVWNLQRKYNLVIAREKSNGAAKKTETQSEQSADGFDMLSGETPDEWKKRIRRDLATGRLKRPN